MMTAEENALLASVDGDSLWKDTERIASFDRRSGGSGEAQALSLIHI